MAKTKAELLEEAKALNLEITEKNTVAEIQTALKNAADTSQKSQVASEETRMTEDKGQETATDKPLAKAGKRSAKALKEAEEEKVKEERKAKATEESVEEKPKQPVKPPRTRLERRGKNFRKSAEKIEKGKAYSLTDAVKLATETSSVKFDASVELHVNLSVDPKQADQNIRGVVALPAGTGKTVRVAVFSDDKVEGADIAGIEAITAQLEKGDINFDVLIAAPANMPKLGQYAKLLGPRGLMPNPKSGTVTTDVAKAVKEAKSGRVEYRVDSTGIVHLAAGKVSFGPAKLEENVRAVLVSIKGAKPASVKGTFVKAIHLATAMGPSITVDPNAS